MRPSLTRSLYRGTGTEGVDLHRAELLCPSRPLRRQTAAVTSRSSSAVTRHGAETHAGSTRARLQTHLPQAGEWSIELGRPEMGRGSLVQRQETCVISCDVRFLVFGCDSRLKTDQLRGGKESYATES